MSDVSKWNINPLIGGCLVGDTDCLSEVLNLNPDLLTPQYKTLVQTIQEMSDDCCVVTIVWLIDRLSKTKLLGSVDAERLVDMIREYHDLIDMESGTRSIRVSTSSGDVYAGLTTKQGVDNYDEAIPEICENCKHYCARQSHQRLERLIHGKLSDLIEGDFEAFSEFMAHMTENPEEGQCRRNAPVSSGSPFPIVMPEDWCGEWRADPKLTPDVETNPVDIDRA